MRDELQDIDPDDEGPGSARPPAAARAAVEADLAILARRRQRGEITDAEFAAAQARLTER